MPAPPARKGRTRQRVGEERLLTAVPQRVAELVRDFAAIWPRELGPLPQPLTDDRYQAGLMVWQEFERPATIRAFRVILPDELRLEHWFEAQPVDGGTLIRHTVEGEAFGDYEAIWRDKIEPGHDPFIEAMFDKIEAAA
jgi:hypothetical protein